ncbi:MAG: signal peptidase II [Deltaproteobacteria bacterium]|nr:signal peptidase II [Deltaproteobacteria bacterium]
MSISKTISTPSFRLNWLIMILLLGLDLGSKIWVRTNVPLYEITELLTNFLDLTHVQNRGVSFSFFADIEDSFRIPLLVGVSLIAVVAMIFYQTRYWNELDFFTRSGLVCVLPGAAGNLIDRAVYGYVTDFFHFRWYETSFFVNNLADCFISLGVVFFIIPLLFSKNDSHTSKAT